MKATGTYKMTSQPLSAACLAVVLTQTCAMYPVKTTFLFPLFSSRLCRSVPVKLPGCSFEMVGSPSWALSSANSSASGVSGVKTGAPAGVVWVTWMMFLREDGGACQR